MHYWDKNTIATKMHYFYKMPNWGKIALLRSIHYFYKFIIYINLQFRLNALFRPTHYLD